MFGRSYAELFGFLGRVGSRVKRILFLCHYVIAAGSGGREPTGLYSGAVGEDRRHLYTFLSTT